MNYIGIIFASFYFLWVYYLAIMNLKRVHDTVGLNGPSKWLGYPLVLFPGVVLDWALNQTAFVIICWDLADGAKELVTGRLKRYKAQKSGWRYKFAMGIAKILDAFDPSGRHV